MSESLEQRVDHLESEVTRLKALIEQSTHVETSTEVPWWEKIVGTFANEPMYDEAMELGRQYRESLCEDKLDPKTIASVESENKQLSQSNT